MQEEYDFSQGQRGPVAPKEKGKTRITIRLDTDIVQWFRDQVHAKGGGNYQTMINEALRLYVRSRSGFLEETLRRIIREELRHAS